MDRGVRDVTTALAAQLTEIFGSIRTSIDRPQRCREHMEALFETLCMHARDFEETVSLQRLIFKHVVELGNVSLPNALEALRLISDVTICLPHTKRQQSISTLMLLVERCKDEASCTLVLQELRALLLENAAHAAELVATVVDAGGQMIRSAGSNARTVGFNVLIMLVHSCPQLVKGSRSTIELFRTVSPTYLLNETLNNVSAHTWFRQSAIRLLTEVIRSGVFELSSSTLDELVREVVTAVVAVTTEAPDQGGVDRVLVALSEFALCRQLSSSTVWSSYLSNIQMLLRNTPWEMFPAETQRLAIQATCSCDAILEPGEATSILGCHLALCPTEAVSALRTVIESHSSIPVSTAVWQQIRQCVETSSQNNEDQVSPCLLALTKLSLSLVPDDQKSQRVEDLLATVLRMLETDLLVSAASLLTVLSPTGDMMDLARAEGNAETSDTERRVLSKIADILRSPQPPPKALFVAGSVWEPKYFPRLLRSFDVDDPATRQTAATVAIRTCRHLILGQQDSTSQTKVLDKQVSAAVETLLDAAVADMVPEIRLFVLSSLTSEFDAYLSLPDNLDALSMAKSDSFPAARRAALALLCRLSKCNPGFVIPPFRRYQENTLLEVESKDTTLSEVIWSVQVLRLVLERRSLMIQSKQVELVVMDRLVKGALLSRQLCHELLELLRALADASVSDKLFVDASKYLSVLSPLILEGHTTQQRVTALNALISVVRTIGAPVESPQFTDVFRLCGGIISNERDDDETRKHALHLLSILGAVNPVKIRAVTRVLETEETSVAEEKATQGGFMTIHKPKLRSHPLASQRYPSVVLYLLTKMLQSSPAPNRQQEAIRCAYETLRKSPPNQKSALLSSFYPLLLRWLSEPDKTHLFEYILKILADLSSLLKPFKDVFSSGTGSEILRSLQLFCQLPQASQKPLNVLVVELLDELARALSTQDFREHRWTVEFIIQRLSRDKEDTALILRVVKSLDAFSSLLHERDMLHVLPQVLQCVDARPPSGNAAAARQVNCACFDFLSLAVERQMALVKDSCALVVHTLLRFLDESTEQEDRHIGIQTLALIIESVGPPAKRFSAHVYRMLAAKELPPSLFDTALQKVGTLRIRLPAAAKQDDGITVDLPLGLTSSLPGLSKEEFESELSKLQLEARRDFEVISVSHPSGQTVVHFRFLSSEGANTRLQSFLKLANDTTSPVRRNLGIVSVQQQAQQSITLSQELLTQLSTIPEARKKKREQSWIQWLSNVTYGMLRISPSLPLRVMGSLTLSITQIKEVFPFAIAAVLELVDKPQRQAILSTFSQCLSKAPYDIRQVLFLLAEYLEAERGENKISFVKNVQAITCIVERDSPDKKFGINYDQEAKGIVVTKLAAGGPGALANVPVGGYLQQVNGKKVTSVNQIPDLIKGLTRLELLFHRTVEEVQTSEDKILMDLPEMAKVAFDSQMHAKAIYFSETLLDKLFRTLGEGKKRKDAEVRRILDIVERLMEFYNHLGLSMEAQGLVRHLVSRFSENIIAPEQFGFDEAGTLEQLNYWRDALQLYKGKVAVADGSIDSGSFLGMLRCLTALGEATTVRSVIQEHWESLDSQTKAEVQPYQAAAAFTLSDWDLLDGCENVGTMEHCAQLFRQKEYPMLLKFIREERDARFEKFCDCFDESYIRAYDVLMEMEHLSHFEELVGYATGPEERRGLLKSLWRRRAAQMSRRAEHWATTVAINSLVLTEEEDMASLVECVHVSYKQGWQKFADFQLAKLMGVQLKDMSQPQHVLESALDKDPSILHAFLKSMYHRGKRVEAHRMMHQMLESRAASTNTNIKNTASDDVLGKCWLLLGDWTVLLNPAEASTAIKYIRKSTELSPKNPSAFHLLGIRHHQMSRDTQLSLEARRQHSVFAVEALLTSVQLSSEGKKNSVMQDMLRILAIWFAQGAVRQINEAIREGLKNIPDHVWLQVIPQLIARMGINSRAARELLKDLLIRLGSCYPHALIYPLTVSEKSNETKRRGMAEKILEGIRQTKEQLVVEASTVSNELVRMAILWTEKWHARIQMAATKQTDPVEILRILQPLYDELELASTPHEKNFEKLYGQTLRRAKSALQSKTLDTAWQLLKQVYMNLAKTINERKLVMSEVSPVLDSVSNCSVAVPGTFDHAKTPVTIVRFLQRIAVMPSKQKPRRFGLEGSDGKVYRFLLKGHEDLRQDERVMQFLDLINNIFLSDSQSMALELAIPRYAVIPLTDNVGLIGWVENTETIYKMLETRRQEYNISVYEEVNLIIRKGNLQSIDQYHHQTKDQRRVLLTYACANSPRDELARIVWDRNDSCEHWLEYRREYAHTLGIMSMVGYVLGLGDRHLNNLMVQQDGSVVHIDFGDCFEVAMHRSIHAEAVPFRLTRLLVTALGVAGVNGPYRQICELVMGLLRRHKENLLSILEAFIYDPLINWKLAAPQPQQQTPTPAGGPSSQAAAAAAAASKQPPTASATVVPQDESYDKEREFLGEDVAGQQKQPALSCTLRTVRSNLPMGAMTVVDGEDELRNQQADVALLRVHAKLSGMDFGDPAKAAAAASTTLSNVALADSEMIDSIDVLESRGGSFGDSPKDSVAGGPLTATYLLHHASTSADSLDVSKQVDRLIMEATSMDNLVEAYITGWAPFW